MSQRNVPPAPPPLPSQRPAKAATPAGVPASGAPAEDKDARDPAMIAEEDWEGDRESQPTMVARQSTPPPGLLAARADASGPQAPSPPRAPQFRSIPTPTAAFTPPDMSRDEPAASPAFSPPAPHPPFPPRPGAPTMMGGFGHSSSSPAPSAPTPPPISAQIPIPQPFPPPMQPQAMGPYAMQPAPTAPPQAQQQLLAPGAHPMSAVQSVALRADVPKDVRPAAAHVVRSRAYAFVLDTRGMPIEIGSGRFAKAYLGEERWLESKTDFRRYVVIKLLQKGVSEEDRLRFQIEKELLERVQGHPNIITLFASGESDDPDFIPATIRDKVENDFVILEKMDMSLEERLKGSRARGKRDDLLACDMRDRLFKVLDYMIPVASAVEYAHLVRNVCHRDIKPANILVGLPDQNLRGSTLEVRLADFNVAKLHDSEVSFAVTQLKSVPGTLFFQSPEQETNVLELLVNVTQGSPEVEFFEDFYIQIEKNDTFALFNRGEQYMIQYAERAKKRLVLDRPYRDVTEMNVRAKVQKSVGRPADIYSLGALFYYLISGAYANPKTLYDAFHKFIEYEQATENNTIDGYLTHEYSVIESLRAPKTQEQGVNVAPADRFFTYKQYLDGNGELIDPAVMKIIAKCMIRNKPDSYCQAHDIDTRGISDLVQDLIDLYALYGFHPSAGSTQLARRGHAARGKGPLARVFGRVGNRLRWMWAGLFGLFRRKR